jgi:hypothetical protein
MEARFHHIVIGISGLERRRSLAVRLLLRGARRKARLNYFRLESRHIWMLAVCLAAI